MRRDWFSLARWFPGVLGDAGLDRPAAQQPGGRRLSMEPLDKRELLAITDLGGIQGFIFRDTNNDGTFQTSGANAETGISGVTVELFNDVNNDGKLDGGDTKVQLNGQNASTTTNSTGLYQFVGLTAGNYLAVETVPTGLLISGPVGNTNARGVVIDSAEASGRIVSHVDNFETSANVGNTIVQTVAQPGVDGGKASATFDGDVADILGKEREFVLQIDSGTNTVSGAIRRFTIINDPDGRTDAGVFDIAIGSQTSGTATIRWDGDADSDPNVNNFGLNNVNLKANGGTGLSILADADNPGTVEIILYTDANNKLSRTINLTNQGVPLDAKSVQYLPFVIGPGNFTATGANASFESIQAIEMIITGDPSVDPVVDNLSIVGYRFNPDVNIGNVPAMNLGNLVWNDLNANGIFDSSTESGIGGVALDLFEDTNNDNKLDSGDTKIGSTTTTASGVNVGQYQFNNLLPGNYFVQIPQAEFGSGRPLFNLSPGTILPTNADTNIDNDNNGAGVTGSGIITQRITLNADGEPDTVVDGDGVNGNNTLDIGVVPKLSLGNLVWSDNNNNGLFDSGTEAGIGGVTVELFIDTDNSGTLTSGDAKIDTKTTTASGADVGKYLFTNLDPGKYFVRIPQDQFTGTNPLANFRPSTILPSGANGNIDNDNNGAGVTGNGIVSQPIDLALGAEPDTNVDGDGVNGNLTLDIGVVPRLSLGNLVWIDLDNNGKFDSGTETGRGGVTVNLFRDNGTTPGVLDSGDTAAGSTTTNSTAGADLGKYQFTNLDPGNYLIQIPNTQFTGTGPLVGFVSSTDISTSANPNNNTDNDDNGTAFSSANGIVTGAITVGVGLGPDTGVDGDGTNGNNTLDVGVVQQIDLQIEKRLVDAVNDATVNQGEEFDYTITVRNNGPGSASSVRVVDTLPSQVTFVSATGGATHSSGIVSFDAGNLAANATATFTILVRANSNLGTSQVVANNTARVERQGFIGTTAIDDPLESNSNNNTSAVDVNVEPPFDLRIVKDASVSTANAGGTFAYNITVTNLTGRTAPAVRFTDALPAGITFVSGTTSIAGRTVTATGQNVTSDLGDLAVGASATITLNVRINSNQAPGTITNTGVVASTTDPNGDVNTTNNSDPADISVTRNVDLVVVKEASASSVNSPGTLTYTIRVTNAGPSDATNVSLVDLLPASIPQANIGQVTTSQGTTAITTVSGRAQVTATIGALAAGAPAVVITIPVTIPSGVTTNLTNDATVSTTDPETNTTNNTASVNTTVTQQPASVAGRVYVDQNNNGRFDTGEAPISGVTITLTGTDNRNDTVNRTTTTGADGTYRFDNLVPGTYTLTETQPAGFLDGQETLGNSGGTVGPDNFSQIGLDAGENATGYDFGEGGPSLNKRQFLASALNN